MTDLTTEYVIAQRYDTRRGRYTYVPVADLPHGTWRVTVHDDGTIERVALRRSVYLDAGRFIARWTDDVPTEPEDGAR